MRVPISSPRRSRRSRSTGLRPSTPSVRSRRTRGRSVTDNRGAQGTDTALVTVTGLSGGSQRWAQRFGSTNTEFAYGVAVDSGGNVLMTGQAGATTDLGGGAVCPTTGVFVAKYSAAGA